MICPVCFDYFVSALGLARHLWKEEGFEREEASRTSKEIEEKDRKEFERKQLEGGK